MFGKILKLIFYLVFVKVDFWREFENESNVFVFDM